MQAQFKGGDDAERTATSTEGPEQIWFVILVDDSGCAINTDNLKPRHVINRESS